MDPSRRKREVPHYPMLAGLLFLAMVSCRARDEVDTEKQPEDVIRSARIVGPSMAPHLLGAHATLSCSNCERGFTIDAISLPSDLSAVCPNCGFTEIEIDEASLVEAQQVEVVEFNAGAALPPRWTVVAFQHPIDKDTLAVKRLLGYPGDSIRIERGDVFVNGERLRKDFAAQWEMRINVHHDSSWARRSVSDGHEPEVQQEQSSAPLWTRPRWISPKQGWSRDSEGWTSEIETNRERIGPSESQTTRSLVYHHYRCAPSRRPNLSAVPVDDNYGYNQTLARNLHPCSDLMVSGLVRLADGAHLQISVHNGFTWISLEIDSTKVAARVYELLDGSSIDDRRAHRKLLGEFSIDNRSFANFQEIAVSTFDRQVTVAIGREEVFRVPWSRGGRDSKPSFVAEPVRFDASGAAVALRYLLVDRDVHFLSPEQSSEAWDAERDDSSGVFLMGDNVPVSRDSRHWRQDAVMQSDLLGTVRTRRRE